MKTVKVVIEPQPHDPTEVAVTKLASITDASVDNLRIQTTLDYVLPSERADVISECVDKVRYGGTIEIYGVDIDEISRSIFLGELTLNDINDLLYNNRRSISNLHDTVNYLVGRGLTIKIKRVHERIFYVKAIREQQ